MIENEQNQPPRRSYSYEGGGLLDTDFFERIVISHTNSPKVKVDKFKSITMNH